MAPVAYETHTHVGLHLGPIIQLQPPARPQRHRLALTQLQPPLMCSGEEAERLGCGASE